MGAFIYSKSNKHFLAQSGIHGYLMDVMIFKHLIKEILKSWLHAIVAMHYFYCQCGETGVFKTQFIFIIVNIF